MMEEMTIINASYEFWDVPKGGDWADIKAREICGSFLGIDGYQNHGTLTEQFNWPAMCERIAAALRAERARF